MALTNEIYPIEKKKKITIHQNCKRKNRSINIFFLCGTALPSSRMLQVGNLREIVFENGDKGIDNIKDQTIEKQVRVYKYIKKIKQSSHTSIYVFRDNTKFILL